MKNCICISASTPELDEQAQQLASRLTLPYLPRASVNTELLLELTPLQLQLLDLSMQTEIHVDFTAGALAHRKKYGGGRGQTIAKAIGMKPGQPPPSILDATAGLAKDAFVFACLGCPVTLIERSPVVAALVEDAIARAKEDSEFTGFIQNGFKLLNTDAKNYITSLTADDRPDVIYLDPMYPERKKSALVKKNMQILQKLLGKDEDSEQLLLAALDCARKRVVVKRPKGAKQIPGKKPTLAYESKTTRYDVYIIPEMNH